MATVASQQRDENGDAASFSKLAASPFHSPEMMFDPCGTSTAVARGGDGGRGKVRRELQLPGPHHSAKRRGVPSNFRFNGIAYLPPVPEPACVGALACAA